MAETTKPNRTPEEKAARKLAKKARRQAGAAPGTGKQPSEARKARKQAKRAKKAAAGAAGAQA